MKYVFYLLVTVGNRQDLILVGILCKESWLTGQEQTFYMEFSRNGHHVYWGKLDGLNLQKSLIGALVLDPPAHPLKKNDAQSYLKAGLFFSQKLQSATGHLKKEKSQCAFKVLKINKFIKQKHKSVEGGKNTEYSKIS